MPDNIGASTPLCPAGHLPLKGGDWLSRPVSPISNIARWAVRPKLLISPLEGEMSGRTEGGRTGRPHSAVSYE
ncbi:lytic murein transglycosylase [Mesorhizobium sp. WSM4303]|nr:lytic murein transglycosylase [Mesorhizobium sp. WSM4306]TRD07725.1 lytic murein transglycosylase [Mesorhizobium sp. WSM4303]